MIHVARACALAFKAIETAETVAAERKQDGGMRYRATDPRAGLEAGVLVPAGDDLEQGAMCPKCFDQGLVAIFLDGAPARARCECPKGKDWIEKAAAHSDIFPTPPPERPRHASDRDDEPIGGELESDWSGNQSELESPQAPGAIPIWESDPEDGSHDAAAEAFQETWRHGQD